MKKAKDTDDQIKALQSELLDLDQHLEETHSKLQQLEIQSGRDKDDFQLRERKLKQQIARLQQELVLSQEERLKEQQAAQDQVQIAVASVKAADKREQSLRQDVERLEAACQRLEQENKQLRNQEVVARNDSEKDSPEFLALQQEISRLNDQVRSMRLTHAAELASVKRKASEELQAAEESYQREIPQPPAAMNRPWYIRLARRVRGR